MRNETRLQATKYIWTAFGLTMFFLMMTAGIFAGGLDASYVVLGVFISIAAIGATGLVWESIGNDSEEEAMLSTEKAKRDRLDSVLRDLSSEDLRRLKQRLHDGTIDDDLLYEEMTIGDDGELVMRERRS
ncbi:MAG: hypothetical protein AAFR67_10155 [Chloroflexota bacterium]